MGGVGAGVAVPLYPTGAGDSEMLAFPDSNLESEGLSVLGGEVRPCINGGAVGCAAKYAANPEG
jgi:hypothetical protein